MEEMLRPLGSRLLRDPRDRRIGELEPCERVSIVGVPWDWMTAGDPGARHAPVHIIRGILGLPAHSPTLGEYPCAPRLRGEVAVAPGDWSVTRSRIRSAASLLLREGFTLFVGGDHSITLPILEALHEGGECTGLLMLDAHYDLRSTEGGVTSGAWLWEAAQAIGRGLRVAVIGVGEYQNPPYLAERARELGFRVVPAARVHDSIEYALEAVDWLAGEGCDRYYVTVDMDHVAEAYAPGVNSPSPLGLLPWQTLKVLWRASRLRPRGADIVEVVPVKDRGGATVRLASTIGAAILHQAARGWRG